MYTKIKATAISMKPRQWDKAWNADKLEVLVRQSAQEGQDVIVAPEGLLEGYVVMDVIQHPENASAMLDIAEPINGPYVNRFRRLAAELKTCICFGFAEKIGSEIYNSAVFLDDEGDICGKYHKTQLAEGTHSKWYFNRIGTEIRAFDTPVGRVGILICNDRWNPMIARTLVLDGAQIILIVSNGSKRKGQNDTVLARARENGVPIVEANVGMNLIISKGEIAAYKWGNDQITTAVVDVPTPPSLTAARALEDEYLSLQGPEMKRRCQKTLQRFGLEDA